MDIKLLLAVLAGVITIISYYPYVRDIFLKKTRPHAYTWLIWLITQGTATVALLYGGGGWGSVSLVIGTVLVFFVFLLSLRFGTRNITKSDTVVLVFALLAIVVWWQLDSLLLAVLVVSAIDGLGYIPTYRKSWRDPRSETILFWVGMVIVIILSLLALAEYNLLTVTYMATLGTANAILVILCIWRRVKVPAPISDSVVQEIELHKQWVIKASVEDVVKIMTDFERLPEHFPKVAESVRIDKREGNNLEMEATVKSFGRNFKVKMRTKILSGRGFISDNDSYQFGTSGHEELLLSEHPEGTLVDYTYKVSIHKPWLRVIATPLLKWYSMKFWEKAVIDELKKILEK